MPIQCTSYPSNPHGPRSEVTGKMVLNYEGAVWPWTQECFTYINKDKRREEKMNPQH